jgi:hypothetical protein
VWVWGGEGVGGPWSYAGLQGREGGVIGVLFWSRGHDGGVVW